MDGAGALINDLLAVFPLILLITFSAACCEQVKASVTQLESEVRRPILLSATVK